MRTKYKELPSVLEHLDHGSWAEGGAFDNMFAGPKGKWLSILVRLPW